jgi:hypothetical protein
VSSTGAPSQSQHDAAEAKGISMTELNAVRARRAIVEHTRRLADFAAAAGPDTAVPTTSEWTITDLVEHVGQTLQWLATDTADDAGAWLVERRPEGRRGSAEPGRPM